MHKILVRFPNWLGDLVMAQPVIPALKEIYPNSEITVLVKNTLLPVFELDPCADRLWSFEKSSFSRLKKEKFDLGVLLTNSFSSAWHFFRGKVANRLGYESDMRSLLLNLKVPFFKKKQHQMIAYQEMLQSLQMPAVFAYPKLYVSENEKSKIRQKLCFLGCPKNTKIIAFSPFAAFGEAKCWPLKNYLELAAKILNRKDVCILLLGEKAFLKTSLRATAALPGRIKKKIINLVGKTSLRELMAVLSISDLLVANDSGPMHVSAALKRPLIALFGPTNPALTGPIYNKKAEVIYKQASCSPCYKRECGQKEFCLDNISSEEVLQKVLQKIKVAGGIHV